MENNAIELSFCKTIYKDGELYIGIMASCPSSNSNQVNDTFSSCEIVVHYMNGNVWTEFAHLDYSDAVNNKSEIKNMFNISEWTTNSSMPDDCIYEIHLKSKEGLTKDALISDVRFVYECMLDKLTKSSDDCCDAISDDIIRMYLTLYGHTTAMQYGDLPTAKEFYKRLLKCGCKCTPVRKPSCGCK